MNTGREYRTIITNRNLARQFCLLIALVFMSFHSPAQLSEFDYFQLNVNKGLSQNMVSAIEKDRLGRLWIGTGNGLNVFDGYQVRSFFTDLTTGRHLPGNRIRSVYADSTNTIWFGTDKGIGAIYPGTDTMSALYTQLDLAESSILFRSGEHLWVNSGCWGIVSVHLKTGACKIEFPEEIPCTGNGIIGRFSNGAVFSWRGNALYQLSKQGYINSILELEKNIQVRYISHHDSVLLISTGNGLFKYSFATKVLQQVEYPLLKGKNISGAILDLSNHLVVAAENEGVYIFDMISGKLLEQYASIADRPLFGLVKSLLVDEYNNIWVGTDGGGLIRLNFNHKKILPIKVVKNGKQQSVNYFTRPVVELKDGRLVIGTLDKGLCMIDRTTQSEELIPLKAKGRQDVQVLTMAVSEEMDDLVYVGTMDGLYAVNLSEKKVDTIIGNRRVDVFYKVNGVGYIAGITDSAEVSVFKEQKGRLLKTRSVNFTIKRGLSSIFYDTKAHQFICCYRGFGLSMIGENDFMKGDTVENHILFPHVKINSIVRSLDGGYVLATSGGLIVTDSKLVQVKQKTRRDGLRDDFINNLQRSQDGLIWASSNSGILSFDDALTSVRLYDQTDGISELEFNTGSGIVLRSGEIVFGGVAGPVIFDPLIHNIQVPDAYPVLSEYNVNATKIFFDPSLLRSLPVFTHKQNSFQFTVYSTDFTAPQRTEYAFRLEGADKDWTAGSPLRTIWYHQLPPGHYMLYAKCTNSLGVWGGEQLLFQFKIDPPFWGTTWFLVGSGLLVLVSIAVISAFLYSVKLRRVLFRERRAKQIENIRSAISRNIHDEIGAGLSKVALMASLAKRTNDKSKADDYHDKLVSTSRDLTRSLGEIVWAVNPRHDNFKSMIYYIRDYIYEAFEHTEIVPEIEIPEIIPEISVNPDFRNNLFLTIKEAINNVIKHSGASKFRFILQIENGKFELNMRDNGVGFKPDENKLFGNGLSNMQIRMKEVGLEYTVSSVINEGTHLYIRGNL